jgi:hypothetical protein
MIESAQLLVREANTQIGVIRRGERYFASTVKATEDRSELYLTTFFPSNPEDARRIANNYEVIRNRLF